MPVPDAVPDDVAAAAMLQGMTAHYLVHAIRAPEAGGTALVHAAAGGTGLLAGADAEGGVDARRRHLRLG